MALDQDEALRIQACLLGGAIGDALGAPVEFNRLSQIRARFGPAGVTDFAEAYGREGAITDDTQMTLFTAEGLVRGFVRSETRGMSHAPSVIHHAYLRWFYTQGSRPRAEIAEGSEWPDGWLVRDGRLFSRRSPGRACMTALGASRRLGEPAQNDSKGCGTVMRVAPIGLLFDSERAYGIGKETSALTHGHPTGIVSGGAFARLLAHLAAGVPLSKAVVEMRAFVAQQPSSEETVAAIDAAVKLAEEGGEPTAEAVESLGGGWVAEEAMAIAIYCALVARSFEHGVLLAVNHGGDSDSTGSMTGQLLGLIHGFDAIPERWRTRVELHDVIETLSRDLAAVRAGTFDAAANWDRYPGW
ncbi:MAG: ADP-ribosylglycohydrolase family protein [Pseudomonadota bacterium]|nr:MAG: hypothetical protein DIU78_04410 [Pseudomonadota bacterium]